MPPRFEVDGIAVHVDGKGPRTLLMIHGWPDTWRLWDRQVAHFAPRLRCVRFTLPGFDVSGPRRAHTLDELVGHIARVADAVSPQQPLVLMLHDWGCLFGGQFALRHPGRVERVVAIDVGDAGSRAHRRELRLRQAAMVFAYQAWLAAAWKIGGATGDRMTRWMARTLGCRAEPGLIGSCMNYPYWMQWTGAHGGLRAAQRLEPRWPLFYAYGERKPFMFHSRAWIEGLRADARHHVQGFATGHWVMRQAAPAFNAAVARWLGLD